MRAAGGILGNDLSALAKCYDILESNGYTCKIEPIWVRATPSGGHS
jgi:hypothetical protein